MKYFIDLDNTLCYTEGNDYVNSKPNKQRIEFVNNLKEEGHHITIWTGRGGTTGIDWRELTENQLNEWGIKYDELLINKPCYDCYIDDKSFNVDTYWRVPTEGDASRKTKSEIVPKGWGKEIVFVNNNEYCGKILSFNKGKKFSMHYHLLKKETWYVARGKFIFIWIETETGKTNSEYLEVGDVVTNERGAPHQIIALEDGDLFEVSTTHYDSDSYRVWKGN